MRIRSTLIGCTVVVAMAIPTASVAQRRNRGDSAAVGGKEPAVLAKLNECRAITDDRARLACFDASAANLAAARESGEVAVVDRQQIRVAKRGLFGFTLPSLNIFGIGKGDHGNVEPDEVSEITSKITGVGQNADGYYIVTLEDGARWEQIAPLTFGRAPRAGSTITIKKAAMGSFKMQIDQSPAVKARRIG